MKIIVSCVALLVTGLNLACLSPAEATELSQDEAPKSSSHATSTLDDVFTWALESLSLQELLQKPNLRRFDPNLSLDAFKETPCTFAVTTQELSTHKRALGSLLSTHPDHEVHLVAQEGSAVQNGTFRLCANDVAGIRHLTLSDPKGIVTTLSQDFLRNLELSSLDVKHFPALTHIESSFLGEAKLDKLTLNLQALRSMGPFFLQEVFFRSNDAALTLLFPFLETIDSSFMFGASLDALTLTCPYLNTIKEFFLTGSKIRTLTLNIPRRTCPNKAWLQNCLHQTTFNMQDLSAATERKAPIVHSYKNSETGHLSNRSFPLPFCNEWMIFYPDKQLLPIVRT